MRNEHQSVQNGCWLVEHPLRTLQ